LKISSHCRIVNFDDMEFCKIAVFAGEYCRKYFPGRAGRARLPGRSGRSRADNLPTICLPTICLPESSPTGPTICLPVGPESPAPAGRARLPTICLPVGPESPAPADDLPADDLPADDLPADDLPAGRAGVEPDRAGPTICLPESSPTDRAGVACAAYSKARFSGSPAGPIICRAGPTICLPGR